MQHYDWGGYDYIPAILRKSNPDHKPFAEYWLGAHPMFPSRLEDHTDLYTYIRKNNIIEKENNPGGSGDLPYLLKVLDVRQMLSIQVHPDRQGAIKGFEAEERAGIPLSSGDRNYKDKNHKPEMMVALGDFYLLHGFKPAQQIINTLDTVPELKFLTSFFQGNNYRSLYEEVMRLPQEKVNEVLQPLSDRILPKYEKGELQKTEADFWAARAIKEFCTPGNFDRGIFSIYLFNLVLLKKGQGIFQDHGLPHAYLEGKNVEVMANSDNVLRAGLTKKKIDVEELLRHVRFDETIPNILGKENSEHEIYKTPVSEFELHHYHIKNPYLIKASAGETWWLERGKLLAKTGQGELEMIAGEAIFIARDSVLEIVPAENASLFRVLIPRG